MPPNVSDHNVTLVIRVLAVVVPLLMLITLKCLSEGSQNEGFSVLVTDVGQKY